MTSEIAEFQRSWDGCDFDWNLVLITKRIWSTGQDTKTLDTLGDSLAGNFLLVPFCENENELADFKACKHRATNVLFRGRKKMHALSIQQSC